MLLAVDTSTQYMGICLYKESQVVGEMTWRTNRHHTVELAPSIDTLFNRCGAAVRELTALAVATGPGSFTSLRIGLSHLKGMALALHLPMVGIPTLDILAVAQPPNEVPLVACLQAGRKRIAYQVYEWSHRKGWQTEMEPHLATADEFASLFPEKVIICGELSKEQREQIRKLDQFSLTSPALSLRRPAFLAELAWRRFTKKDIDDPATLAPIYLHIAKKPSAEGN